MSTPKTNAGKALVEWAQNAAPNQIDVWREHAVLIESEAYELGIRMVKPDVEAQEAMYTAERITHAYQQGRDDAIREARLARQIAPLEGSSESEEASDAR